MTNEREPLYGDKALELFFGGNPSGVATAMWATAMRNNYEARIAELEAQLSQTWQPLPDGEVFDTITRSLVSSESINDTHTWMRRVDAATKWINALRGKE